eukprot:TRINITY_DN1829_c0_g1_i1.p1 TRINITY_DN1829_c0_g1~~TRINITY_DN1829_c0_g1_i1.p1  ORF type:complete len:168 (-),score=28.57 TRINITY_DN1829_c0_g1_i1:56-559(-)
MDNIRLLVYEDRSVFNPLRMISDPKKDECTLEYKDGEFVGVLTDILKNRNVVDQSLVKFEILVNDFTANNLEERRDWALRVKNLQLGNVEKICNKFENGIMKDVFRKQTSDESLLEKKEKKDGINKNVLAGAVLAASITTVAAAATYKVMSKNDGDQHEQKAFCNSA